MEKDASEDNVDVSGKIIKKMSTSMSPLVILSDFLVGCWSCFLINGYVCQMFGRICPCILYPCVGFYYTNYMFSLHGSDVSSCYPLLCSSYFVFFWCMCPFWDGYLWRLYPLSIFEEIRGRIFWLYYARPTLISFEEDVF